MKMLRRCLPLAILLAPLFIAIPAGQDGAGMPVNALKFRAIGPASMGGRIDDIAVSESDPNIIYVGYAVGGIPDWLIGGETGEIASGDPPSVPGLADAIVRALADGRHYERLCRGAWDFARQFTLDRHLHQLESVLEAACGASAARIANGLDTVATS